MKRLVDRIVKTDDDRPCKTCGNTFRACPMQLVLAMSRVPAGMEVAVIECPEHREATDRETESEKAGKSIGGLIRS